MVEEKSQAEKDRIASARMMWELEQASKRLEKLELQVAQLNVNLREELAAEKEKCERIFALKTDMDRVRDVVNELRKVIYAVITMVCLGVLAAILKVVIK